MKKFSIILVVLMMFNLSAVSISFTNINLKKVSIDVNKRSIVVEDREDSDNYFEIYKNGSLEVDDEEVELNDDQRKLTKKFYKQSKRVYKKAVKIGKEGAKIGVAGAKVGVSAAFGVFKLLIPGYTTEDFEDDVEKSAEALERKAKKLEEQAEKVDEMVDDLEMIGTKMKGSIKDLEELEWFVIE